MEFEELKDALLGLYAFDSGCFDSGIHDESLRHRVIAEISMVDGREDMRVCRVVREAFLEEEALSLGYRLEDVSEFIEWLDERMDYGI